MHLTTATNQKLEISQVVAQSSFHSLCRDKGDCFVLYEGDSVPRKIDISSLVEFRDWNELAELCNCIARSLNSDPLLKDAVDKLLPVDLRDFNKWLPHWELTQVLPSINQEWGARIIKYLGEDWTVEEGPHQTYDEIDLVNIELNVAQGQYTLQYKGNLAENPRLSAEQVVLLVLYVLSDERTLEANNLSYGPFLSNALNTILDSPDKLTLVNKTSNGITSTTQDSSSSLANLESHDQWIVKARELLKNSIIGTKLLSPLSEIKVELDKIELPTEQSESIEEVHVPSQLDINVEEIIPIDNSHNEVEIESIEVIQADLAPEKLEEEDTTQALQTAEIIQDSSKEMQTNSSEIRRRFGEPPVKLEDDEILDEENLEELSDITQQSEVIHREDEKLIVEDLQDKPIVQEYTEEVTKEIKEDISGLPSDYYESFIHEWIPDQKVIQEIVRKRVDIDTVFARIDLLRAAFGSENAVHAALAKSGDLLLLNDEDFTDYNHQLFQSRLIWEPAIAVGAISVGDLVNPKTLSSVIKKLKDEALKSNEFHSKLVALEQQGFDPIASFAIIYYGFRSGGRFHIGSSLPKEGVNKNLMNGLEDFSAQQKRLEKTFKRFIAHKLISRNGTAYSLDLSNNHNQDSTTLVGKDFIRFCNDNEGWLVGRFRKVNLDAQTVDILAGVATVENVLSLEQGYVLIDQISKAYGYSSFEKGNKEGLNPSTLSSYWNVLARLERVKFPSDDQSAKVLQLVLHFVGNLLDDHEGVVSKEAAKVAGSLSFESEVTFSALAKIIRDGINSHALTECRAAMQALAWALGNLSKNSEEGNYRPSTSEILELYGYYMDHEDDPLSQSVIEKLWSAQLDSNPELVVEIDKLSLDHEYADHYTSLSTRWQIG